MSLAARISALTVRLAREIRTLVRPGHLGLARAWVSFGYVDGTIRIAAAHNVASVTRPVRELRGFRRVELQPGESRTVTFELGFDDLSMLDAGMRRVLEPGTFTVFTGGSSATDQQAKFEVAAP